MRKILHASSRAAQICISCRQVAWQHLFLLHVTHRQDGAVRLAHDLFGDALHLRGRYQKVMSSHNDQIDVIFLGVSYDLDRRLSLAAMSWKTSLAGTRRHLTCRHRSTPDRKPPPQTSSDNTSDQTLQWLKSRLSQSHRRHDQKQSRSSGERFQASCFMIGLPMVVN